MKFSEWFKERRMAIGTVRQFAKLAGLDAAYVSRLENGIVLPPRDSEKLRRLGLTLGLKEESEEWQDFLDLVAVSKNELPEDLRDNERAKAILPAFYRTLRNEELDEDEMRKLLGIIKSEEEEE